MLQMAFMLSLTVLPANPATPKSSDIEIVARQKTGTPQGRAAWKRLVQGGPELLPPLLRAMDTDDIVAVNWLRTAFDRILARQLKSNAKKIDTTAILAFVKDAKRQGRARRFALEVVEQLRPGTTAKLLFAWLDDPEFRYGAVENLLDNAGKISAKGSAIRQFKRALAGSRDLQQCRRAAAHLLDFGVEKSVAKHLGFLTDWYVLGPFNAPDNKGFATTYPPEKKVDLRGVFKGQSGKILWKRYHVREPNPKVRTRHVALVNLAEARALGNADDAVGFAYTEITVTNAGKVEFRGAADDNFIVWVNGKRAFGFEEYNNGVRHDRHRFPVILKKGKNTILVKVCQSPPYIAPNWEFILRIADDTGKGIQFRHSLPGSNK